MASPIVIPQQSVPVSGEDSRRFSAEWYVALDQIAKRVNQTQRNGTGGFTEDNTNGPTYTIPNKIDFALTVLTAPCTVTLPDATVGKGQMLVIKNATGIAGGPVGVQTIYQQNMDGAPGLTLPVFAAVILVADGIAWHVVGLYNFPDFHILTTAVNLSVPLASNYAVMASSAVTISLPDAIQDRGRLIDVKSTDASIITISATGGQNIDGSGSVTTTTSILFISDGSNWRQIADFTGATTSSGGVNAQTADYTAVASDSGKLITMSGTSLTFKVPATPPSATWWCAVQNLDATALLVDRNGRNLNGTVFDLALIQYIWTIIYSDGTDYFATIPLVAGTNVTLSPVSNGLVLDVASTFSSSAWTGYTPTTTNLTSVTVNIARGIKFGKLAFVRVSVTGTSNGTFPTFTLPYAALDNFETFAAYYLQGGASASANAVLVGGNVTIGTATNTALANGTVYTFAFQGSYETS